MDTYIEKIHILAEKLLREGEKKEEEKLLFKLNV